MAYIEPWTREESPTSATKMNLRTLCLGNKSQKDKGQLTSLMGGRGGKTEESVLAVSGWEREGREFVFDGGSLA